MAEYGPNLCPVIGLKVGLGCHFLHGHRIPGIPTRGPLRVIPDTYILHSSHHNWEFSILITMWAIQSTVSEMCGELVTIYTYNVKNYVAWELVSRVRDMTYRVKSLLYTPYTYPPELLKFIFTCSTVSPQNEEQHIFSKFQQSMSYTLRICMSDYKFLD